MDHWSLTPDPECKGSYYRRIEDIRRALKKLGIPSGNKAINFLLYFFGCEKLAFGIIGIKERDPAIEAYKKGLRLDLEELKVALAALKISFPPHDLDCLFSETNPESARNLRNQVVHDFGPSNIDNIDNEKADFFIPKMKAFLACEGKTLEYLNANFSHLIKTEP